MTAWPLLTALVLAGYLLGAIPFCFLIGRLYGVDIRTLGSGNIGGTNLRRGLKGKPFGGPMALIGLILDSMKGFAAALWLPMLAEILWRRYRPDSTQELAFELRAIIAGVAAVVGHSFTCFLKFKGGKGVATGLGVFLVVCWPAALIGLGVFAVAYLFTRITSVGSLAGALAVPIAAAIYWHFYGGLEAHWIEVALMAATVVLVFIRHRSNIGRLIRGEELSFRAPAANAVNAADAKAPAGSPPQPSAAEPPTAGVSGRN